MGTGGAFQPKLSWANKFLRPTAEQLVSQCATKQLGQLVEAARKELSALAGVTETLSWQGVPWRWSFVYTVAGEGEGGQGTGGHTTLRSQPLAYLIPDPQRPQVSVPLTWQMVEALPMRRLKRFVRDGIINSRLVGEIHWPLWDFSARSQLDEILDLVVRKHRLVGAAKPEAVAEGA